MRFRLNKLTLAIALLTVIALTFIPILFSWTSWVVRYSKLLRIHTLTERDLPLGYQVGLNISLAPLAKHELCCEHAIWQQTAEDIARQQIPRIIHQTWKTAELPETGDWRKAAKLCHKLHPESAGWQHILWTDESARNFIKQFYPGVLSVYDAFPIPIQRVDAMRYYILHHFGGIYIDLDIGCSRPMDSLLHLPAFLPITKPIGISNDLIGAKKGHPFMNLLGDQVLLQNSKTHKKTRWQRWIYWIGSTYITVFFSTGPMFVNIQLSEYLKDKPRLSPDSMGILPHHFYSKSYTSYFMHFEGSSWHKSDGAWLVFIYSHFTLLSVIAILLGVGIYLRRRKRRSYQPVNES